MKIVVTGTRGIPNILGGVETHTEELFPRIAKLGGDVTVVRRDAYVDSEMDRQSGVEVSKECSTWRGVKLKDLPSPKLKALESIVHTFRAINEAKRQNADIIHIHAIGPAILTPYAKLRGLKVVFTHHGPDYDRDKWGYFAKFMLKQGERLGCKYADAIIVISNVIKNIVENELHRTQKIHLIYNGVSSPEICSFPEYFQELGIEEGKYVLAMCRFVPEKNLHHLVEAFVKWRKEHDYTDVKLVLAGDADFDDDYSKSLKNMAKDNGVVLPGFVKGRKQHALLSHCSCFVLPSSHEGLPISLLEAMSYRLPVIVSDIPANKEVGLDPFCYFPCGDVNVLKERLSSLLEQPFCRIDYDMSKYDWSMIAEQVMEIYKGLS